LEVGEFHGQYIRIDPGISNDHPLTDKRTDHHDQRHESDWQWTKLLSKTLYFFGTKLNQGSSGDVSTPNIDET